jgi:site-specific recombinase XerD
LVGIDDDLEVVLTCQAYDLVEVVKIVAVVDARTAMFHCLPGDDPQRRNRQAELGKEHRVSNQARAARENEAALAAIDRADLAPSTRAQYRRALNRYFRETGSSITDVEALSAYAAPMPKCERAFLKAVIRLFSRERAKMLKASATPDNVRGVQAALYRLEAMLDAVKVKQGAGTKVHTWLTEAEVGELLATCDNGIVGQRDRVVLGLLVAAGLRREEAAGLRFCDVKAQPFKDGSGRVQRRTVLAVNGKGAKKRPVPISEQLATAIDEWGELVGRESRIGRSLAMNSKQSEELSGDGVFYIVAKRGKMIGKPKLQPHDLRRTYAQLGYEAGIPVTQISRLLGHASLATTQRYLNLELDLETTVSDVIPF